MLLMLKPAAGTVLVTHKSCLDGTGSALMFLWAGGLRKNIIFRKPDDLIFTRDELPQDACEVWYADCCPSNLYDPAGGLPFLVFDHHVSNIRKHKHDLRCTFDIERSGTSLMADVLGLGGHSFNELVKALEDYDLGRFDNSAGMRLADLAATYSQEELLTLFERSNPGDILKDYDLTCRANGAAAIRSLYCDQISPFKFVECIAEGVGAITFGIISAPRDWKNECGVAILRDPIIDVAMIIDSMGQTVSLRSREGGPDCSVIAELYDGGGHARAAGWSIEGRYMFRSMMHQVLW